MARHHRARVHELGGEGRTHVLGEYAGRTDPRPKSAIHSAAISSFTVGRTSSWRR